MKKIFALILASVLLISLCIGSSAYTANIDKDGSSVGDVNLDGSTNNKDVALLFKYVSGALETEPENTDSFDVNLDGGVNNKDVALLFRYVCGEEIEVNRTYEPTVGKKILTNTYAIPIFKISNVFSSNMVLQRDEIINIWGYSQNNGDTVTVTFDGETATTVIEDYEWAVAFAPRSASTDPKTLVATDQHENEVVLENILIGDVWIISGQSNGELNLINCLGYDTPEYDENGIYRLFMQTQLSVSTNISKQSKPQPEVINKQWKWRMPNQSYSNSFSALGYYFAREIAEATEIPIGMISMSANGACIRELMNPQVAMKQGYSQGANVALGGYYNTMIYPFIGIHFKGMIFFQGESETMGSYATYANKYASDLKAHVDDLREEFGFDFPFYNVQLCDYLDQGAHDFGFTDILRSQQYNALSTIENSTLTVSFDLGPDEGYSDYAHSPKKKPLAERVAAQALAREYGIGSEEDATSPMPVSSTLNGNILTVKFANVGMGLKSLSGDNTVSGFRIGKRGSMTEVTATITGVDTVTIDITGISNTAYLSYAYSPRIIPAQNAQLYSSNDLPAAAFYLPLQF